MSENKGCILCVDDEPHVLRALQWLLHKDFEVHTAVSAVQAVQLLRQHDFDVVVSDQRMPDVSGVEFLAHVRSHAPRAMRILLTGYSDADAVVGSVNESEVFRFATKPWDIHALPVLIAEAAAIAREGAQEGAREETRDDSLGRAGTANPAGARPDLTSTPPLPDSAAGPWTGADSPGVVSAAPGRGAAPCVLLIDEDAVLAEALARHAGTTFEVLRAASVAEAEVIAGRGALGVVVSDVRVGGADATALLKRMRREHAEVVVVVISREKDTPSLIDLINQGQIFRFLSKPLDPGALKPVIDAALVRHRELLGSARLRRRHMAGPIEWSAQEGSQADRQHKGEPAQGEPASTSGVGRVVAAATKVPGTEAVDSGPYGAREQSPVAQIVAAVKRLFVPRSGSK